jgi:hypothetical protein
VPALRLSGSRDWPRPAGLLEPGRGRRPRDSTQQASARRVALLQMQDKPLDVGAYRRQYPLLASVVNEAWQQWVSKSSVVLSTNRPALGRPSRAVPMPVE